MRDPKPASAQPPGATATGKLESEQLTADICVIGAGPGGLAVAEAAAVLGRSVIVIEKHMPGGGSLNTGSVPTTALIAIGRRANAIRMSAALGIKPTEPEINMPAVRNQIESAIDALAPMTSAERMTALGIRLVHGAARFFDKRTVTAGEYTIRARRFVIATGSTPKIPAIKGLELAPYFTTETIFSNDRKIGHLIVIGGTSEALEIAQAYARLGSRVTVLCETTALQHDDAELTAILLGELRAEAIDIREHATVDRIETATGRIRVVLATGTDQDTIEGTHLLLAAGRQPNLADLNLDFARIKHTADGITVGRGLRTSNSHVYAIGDATGARPYANIAAYHAEIVASRALFRLPAKVDDHALCWATFTDPELAHAGITEATARSRKLAVNVLRWPFTATDRAVIEGETAGHIKIVTDKKGHVLGATIAGTNAAEAIGIWSLAIRQRLTIDALAEVILPYPIYGEAGRRAALRSRLAAATRPSVRKAVNLLAKLG